ncbi:MAG TPA: hypothetical protein VF884_01205, partial [Nitrososphaeraceae archaeon]
QSFLITGLRLGITCLGLLTQGTNNPKNLFVNSGILSTIKRVTKLRIIYSRDMNLVTDMYNKYANIFTSLEAKHYG